MLTPARKLEIQFTKALRNNFVKNAKLHPRAPGFVVQRLEDNEPVIVRIDARTGYHYWFTDRRILLQIGNSLCPLFRYECVNQVHWMYKKPTDPSQKSEPSVSAEEMTNMEMENYDRLVVDLGQSQTAIEGLDQAYIPTLSFLQWLISVQPRDPRFL